MHINSITETGGSILHHHWSVRIEHLWVDTLWYCQVIHFIS